MRDTWKLVAVVALCGSLISGPGTGPAAAEEKPTRDAVPKEGGPREGTPREKEAARPKPKANLDWVTLEVGIERLREKYQPALILYEPDAKPLRSEDPASPAAARGFLDEHLTDTTLRDAFRRFVLIRIGTADLAKPYPEARAAKAQPGKEGKEPKNEPEPPKEATRPEGDPAAPGKEGPPVVGTKLELTEGKPALIPFSFREEVIKRYDDSLPTRTQLKRELTRIAKVSELHAREARRVEPELERSLYAFRLGKAREAVLLVVPIESKDARRLMDETLSKRVDGVIAEYRGKAGEALAAADDLEAKKKYEEAIKAYDGVGRDYPFPDILKEANKRKSVTLRKLTVGY